MTHCCSVVNRPPDCSFGPGSRHRRYYAQSAWIKQVTDLPPDQQDVISHRARRLKLTITKICAHHYYVHFFKYTTPTASKLCTDPLGNHGHPCRGTTVITNTLAQSLESLDLVSGDRLCPKCYIQCTKMKKMAGHNANGMR